MKTTKKTLSIFGLAMINVIAIDSLRSLPINAEYGLACVFYYILTALVFFVPSALVAAELASAWPETGGIYIWVREAFGKKIGFITIWLQWFYNICWYPTIMSLVAATIAYCINPALVHNKTYMVTIIMVLYWGCTLINCLGMRASSLLSNLTAIIGTLIPMVFVIILGAIWVLSGHEPANSFAIHHMMPDLSHANHLVILTAMLYGFVGIEMSAAHAGDVKNPQRDYPVAVLWSVIVILITMVLGTLAILTVIPVNQLNLIAGLLQAFQAFFSAFHLHWVMPVLAVLISVGGIGSAAAWMLGPSKGMLAACQDGSLPRKLGRLNKRHAPVRVLLLQGVIFTALCSAFLFMPTVNSAFWALTDITSILALVVYLAMFAAALYLRYKHPKVKRTFTIPGGKVGIWIVCSLGFLSSLLVICLGFLPPSQVDVGDIVRYETIIAVGVIAGCILPVFLYGLTHWFSRQ